MRRESLTELVYTYTEVKPAKESIPYFEALADDELSIGDYVLTNGALPAMVVIDAVARLLPGVLGDDESSHDESFSQGLLEYPQWTRPADFRGLKVPEVLLNGNHAEIEKWRREQAKLRTKESRPDLLK